MKLRNHSPIINSRLIAAVACALAAFVMVAWFLQWLWQSGGELDRRPSVGVMDQVMHRKSAAMQGILDGVVAGNWQRVETAAEQMAYYGDTIRWYLSSAEYSEHGEHFHQSVNDLRSAIGRKDHPATVEATLRLEKSCLECHMLINAAQTGRKQEIQP